ncbi:unnamed protein product, partial [marine sediment metagenome]
MPGKIAAVHHTLADWDFQYGAVGRLLDTDFFISEPTSLKMFSLVGAVPSVTLCRIPATLCLPQGELRTWFRTQYLSYQPFMFRNQAPLGVASQTNCYLLLMTTNRARLRRYVAGAMTDVYSTTCYNAVDEWIHYRVFWYNGKTPAEEDALCV